MLNIVLHEPEMPANTGNIGRTCVAAGARLHLIEPLGFKLNEKMLKRAGLDYWDKLDVTVYSDYQDFLERNPDALELETLGPRFEHDPLFPERVNTEFIQVIDRHTLKMRGWERGSGETWACGTGACAAAVAAVENGCCDRNTDITVKLRGGDLVIRVSEETVYLTGGARTVFEGVVEI